MSKRTAATGFLGPATLVVTVMLAAPLLLLLRFSLNRFDIKELMIETVTAENYLRFFTDPFYLGVLRTTVLVAVTLLGEKASWSRLGLLTVACAMVGVASRV